MSTPPRRPAALTALVVAVVGLALALAACGGETSADGGVPGGSGSAATVVGAGASFPYPLYSAWGQEYNGVSGVKLNYQSIGSSGGIAAIQAKTVDFGASDAPLAEEELASAGLLQFPMCVGGVVPVVNLEGIADGQLRLTGALLARLFMGEITRWNDAALAAANPGVELPDAKVNIVHRSDGSGTTWIFTNYLTAVAGDVWTAGADKEIAWPTGVGGKGNEGVAASVQQLSGSIGYVEYAYAKQTQMTSVQLQNKDGEWVRPSLGSFSAAAAEADWESALPAMDLALVDQPGAATWPITGASFILIQKDSVDAAQVKAALAFFDWAFENGSATAERLDYVPLPANVYQLVESDVWSNATAAGAVVWE